MRSVSLRVMSVTTIVAMIFCVRCDAQDMRVYTSVTDVSSANSAPQVLSHSLTLFHAGKAYDYMEEVGEVVIFEPMHSRFIILGKNYSATKVTFSELNHFLESARRQSDKYIMELTEKGDAASLKAAAAVRFQLSPELDREFLSEQNLLSVKGGHLSYLVECSTADAPQAVTNYLEYADWFSRLNYVLHPHSAYPEARLQVNAALREKNMLPVKVELNVVSEHAMHLRAEHSYSWKFQSVDRKHISHWEQTLESDKVQWMTFHQYQEKLLVNRE